MIKKRLNIIKKIVLRQRKRVLFFVLALALIIIGSIYRHELKVIAASYTWTQTDWSGGASTSAAAIHPGDQSGWNKYYSASQVETTGGMVKLPR